MEEVFEFGRRLQADGRYAEAEKCYRRYLEDHTDSYKAWNNLGVVVENQDKLDDAIECFNRATDLVPDSPIPRYNLGHALYQQEQLDEAASQFSALLSHTPDHGPSRLNLGVIYWRQNKIPAAEEQLRLACKTQDVAPNAYSRLGTLMFDMGRLVESRDCHYQAAQLDEQPHHFFHAAVCENLLDNIEEAITGFERALKLDPRGRIVHEHYVRALMTINDQTRLADALSQWNDAIPGDPICEHMRATIDKDSNISRCSSEYVRDTFSAFAGDFDETLAKLQYNAPKLVVNTVRKMANNKPLERVLDAGCGTGLCGQGLKSFSQTLIGVDLAEPMLAQARKLDVYDELLEADLVDYLQTDTTTFNAVIAADTFNYFGDLSNLLSAVFDKLSSDGYLVFTLEQSHITQASFQLMPHGRFEHSRQYVEQTLAEHRFTCIEFENFVLRTENGKDVKGWLIQARKD